MVQAVAKPASILLATSFARVPVLYEARLRCKPGELFFTKGVIETLAFGDRSARVAVLLYGDQVYVTKSDHPDAFNVTYKYNSKNTSIISGGTVHNKGLTTQLRRAWNLDPDDLAVVSVMTNYQVSPHEIGQTPETCPYPIYRLATDTIKKVG